MLSLPAALPCTPPRPARAAAAALPRSGQRGRVSRPRVASRGVAPPVGQAPRRDNLHCSPWPRPLNHVYGRVQVGAPRSPAQPREGLRGPAEDDSAARGPGKYRGVSCRLAGARPSEYPKQ